ncbi:MAG: alpha/beta hydrolase [Ruminococcaceae bacterium]|nr:alpha/beta hydrolase [Oscillospiraceae bacterium]
MIWRILGAAAVLAAGFLGYGYLSAFYQPPRRGEVDLLPKGTPTGAHGEMIRQLVEELQALQPEEITIEAPDGTPLFARYYHVKDGAPIQIQCHGYRGTALRDFCGGNHLARELSHNTLVIDQRAHGRSGGTVITFGIRERYDVLAWIDYVNARFGGDTPILLAGVSMGAATVLLAVGLDLPENVRGVIADCPYSSPASIIRRVIRLRHLPVWPAFPLVRLAARLFGGFSIMEGDVEAALQRAYVPVLLIHGEEDHFVPCDMSRRLYRACVSPKMIATFPGAGHGMSYPADPARYREVVCAFLHSVGL